MITALALAAVPVGGAILATGIQIFLTRSTGTRGTSRAGTVLAAALIFVAVFWATYTPARQGLLGMPGDEMLLGWLWTMGTYGGELAPWALAASVTASAAGIVAVLAQVRKKCPADVHSLYTIPGSHRKPSPAHRPMEASIPARGTVHPVHIEDLPSTMLVLQVKHGTSQASVLYRSIERIAPLLGCALSAFGSAIVLSRTQSQIGWLQIASAGTLITSTLLVALTVTSASGPVSWIPRMRWMTDSGADLAALCRTYLRQLVRLCIRPLILPVLGFCLVQSSVGPAMEAAALIPLLAATAIVADLADRQRQVNSDGSVEGGLTGTLILLVVTAAATTAWLLPWPLAMSLVALMALSMLLVATKLFHRRIHPWRWPEHAVATPADGSPDQATTVSIQKDMP